VCYKIWRSRKDSGLHLLCREGAEVFDTLPAISNSGPRTGGAEDEIDRLCLPYRVMLGEQVFAIIYMYVSPLQLEMVTSAHALKKANAARPQCTGSGDVP
jgi:hypothetical protein